MAKLDAAARNALPASSFAMPGDRKYPIHDRSHAIDALARAAGKAEEGTVRAAVKRKYPGIKIKKTMAAIQAAKSTEVALSVPVWKDDSKQIVYGVVLTPGVMDSQGDICDAGDIETAAHRWLVDYRKHDVQHAEVTAGTGGQPIAEVVESFIAPSDMEISGERVHKGAWVMATHISDPDVWGRVQKGEITGYSIGGTGERVPLAA